MSLKKITPPIFYKNVIINEKRKKDYQVYILI